MVSVTRDRSSGHIVCSTRGPFDDFKLDALLRAIRLAPEEAPVIVDLANTGTLNHSLLPTFVEAVVARKGPVTFRNAGPWHAPILNAVPA